MKSKYVDFATLKDVENQVLAVYGVYADKKLDKVAEFVLGTGVEMQLDPEISEDELFLEREESFYDLACTYGTRLPQHMVEDMKKIVSLKAQIAEIADRLEAELEENYDIQVSAFMNGSPFREGNLTFVSGSVRTNDSRGGKYLHVDGMPAASENEAGHYVHQTSGYCEDDYSGEEYVSIGNDEYVMWHFDI